MTDPIELVTLPTVAFDRLFSANVAEVRRHGSEELQRFCIKCGHSESPENMPLDTPQKTNLPHSKPFHPSY